MLSNPLILLLVQYMATALIVGFTTPTSVLRFAVLPLMATCTAICVTSSKALLVRTPWAATVGGYSVTYLFQYIALALLSGCSYETDGPNSTPAPRQGTERENYSKARTVSQAFRTRFAFGMSAAASFRWAGTKREVKNVPPFSESDPSYVPSRGTFLRHTAARILACYLVIDLMGLGNDEETNTVYFDSTKILFFTRFSEVSLTEFFMRLFVTLGAGLGIYCTQQCLQSIIAFTTVALGFSKPENWRPKFGAMRDAYTIRRFWSTSWHQTNRGIISEPTRFIVNTILRLPRPSLVAQFVSLWLAFLLSGILHMVIDVASGMPWQDSGSMKFFCMQAFGIILEESVQAAYGLSPWLQRLFASRMWWFRVMGRAWVIAFMAWTVPGWMYPMICRTRSGMQDSILPFSILANIM